MSNKGSSKTSKKDGEKKEKKEGPRSWSIDASEASKNTFNPIRNIVDKLVVPKDHPKKLIRLSLGDPTVFGNMDVPDSAILSVIKQLTGKKNNGYSHSCGTPEARNAIAKKFSTSNCALKEDDIVITSGCSGALLLAIQALCNAGDNILIPAPGFPLYQTIASHLGVKSKQYKLQPEAQWEIDLKNMESLIDKDTKCIIVNNPGNPTGSNYSKEHLLKIIAVAEKHCIPIIADEIYANQVFPGEEFHFMGELSREVPILSMCGLAKQYCVPGWRVGWIAICDKRDRLQNIRTALLSLSQLIMGACVTIQAAIPDILNNTAPEFYSHLNEVLYKNASYLYDRISKIPGLYVVRPQASLYVMVGVKTKEFRDLQDDQIFSQRLLAEQMVFVLPGACFNGPNFIRLVASAPIEMLVEACDRLQQFCMDHMK